MTKQIVCNNCFYAGKARKKTRGNILVEIVLWLTFIVPGIIYSLWRLTSKYYACPQCGSRDLIPADSPRGKMILNEINRTV